MLIPKNYAILMILTALFFQSCAIKPRSFQKEFIEESLINLDYQSIIMVNIRTKNTISKKHYLETMAVFLENNDREIVYKCNAQNTFKKIDSQNFCNTFILIPLDPEEYILKFVRGQTWVDTSQGPTIGRGFFQIPLFKKITLEKGRILYSGRIEAVMREKKDDEFAAGPATPLLGQANSGIAKATFDIVIKDEYLIDKNHFVSNYIQLENKQIDRNIIPQWERSELSDYRPPATHFAFYN